MIFFSVVWSAFVFCAPIGSYAAGAYYPTPTPHVELANYVCQGIEHRGGISDQAYAVFVLAHELGHAHDPAIAAKTGVEIEGECSKPGPCEAFADCYAVGHLKRLARTLHFRWQRRLEMIRWVRAHPIVFYTPPPRECWS